MYPEPEYFTRFEGLKNTIITLVIAVKFWTFSNFLYKFMVMKEPK